MPRDRRIGPTVPDRVAQLLVCAVMALALAAADLGRASVAEAPGCAIPADLAAPGGRSPGSAGACPGERPPGPVAGPAPEAAILRASPGQGGAAVAAAAGDDRPPPDRPEASPDRSGGPPEPAPPAPPDGRPARPAPMPAARPEPTAEDGPRPEPRAATRAQARFIRAAAGAARRSERETGVPASVTIAQAILESAWGTSELARAHRNYFGLKARGEPGPAGVARFAVREVVDGQDVVVPEPFRAYRTAAESFADHGRFLLDNPRYAAALAVRRDARRFAEAIAGAGYATDPGYAPKLIGLMDRFDLYAYDRPGRADPR
jgi:flagellum-specific peptidoglycan hydrolase FlgJ